METSNDRKLKEGLEDPSVLEALIDKYSEELNGINQGWSIV